MTISNSEALTKTKLSLFPKKYLKRLRASLEPIYDQISIDTRDAFRRVTDDEKADAMNRRYMLKRGWEIAIREAFLRSV